MALLADKEDISFDDYEEGEILDEDNLFKDVSSSEEISVEETDSDENLQMMNIPAEKTVRKVKKHRKKEHKCKEESICRAERIGKHCYARIKTGKVESVVNTNKTVSPSDKETCKTQSIPHILKKEQGKFKPCVALKISRSIPAPKSLYRNDYRADDDATILVKHDEVLKKKKIGNV